MELLPKWCVTDTRPALYDMESATAIEQTAKLYGAMNQLIEEYNAFADKINADIEAFKNDTTKSFELFSTELRQEFQDFIDVIELKIQNQDLTIKNALESMKNELKNYVNEIYNLIRTELPDNLKEELETINARLENLLGSITEGSTTLDAELIDIRVGYDGTQYATAGEAVRTQIETLATDKLPVPKDTDGNAVTGESGQFLVSDGAGGVAWLSVINGNEVEY